jgi:formate hydrogenlyase subunit 3/multisubunit Na+/H+ antiporter MnhD subunit
LSLLTGIAVLYSHYGVQNISNLVPILHSTPGVGVKSMVAASILLFVGVTGRLGLWPLSLWLTRTATTAPPVASALAQSVWSVVAIVILYRLMPIIAAPNVATLRDLAYASGVAAIVAPLLALFGNEPRRAMVLAGSGVAAVGVALVVHAYEASSTSFAVVGVACVLAAAPARAAATLAVSAIAAAMRTDDLAEMGDGWRRMPTTTLALLLSGLVIALSAAGAISLAATSRSRFGLVLGEAVLLVSITAIRVPLAIAIGPLRRRRAFEPDRVREGPNASLSWAYWLVLAGAALAVASLFPAWIGFLDGQNHKAVSAAGLALWAGVALVGVAVTVLTYSTSKDGALRASAWLGRGLRGLLDGSAAAFSRFIAKPFAAIAEHVSDWIQQGDGELARAAAASGRLALAATRAPAVALIVVLAAALAVAVGLLSPGVFR